MARTQGLTANLNAFLDTIAVSELGKAIIAESDDGYNVLVGSIPGHVLTFSDYSHHPNIVEQVGTLKSTAAGRYQILARYAEVYLPQLSLPDFGPESQDAIAIQMINECHAMPDIEGGYAADAMIKCSSRWASLPAAAYGQHVNKMSDLMIVYADAGGTVENGGLA